MSIDIDTLFGDVRDDTEQLTKEQFIGFIRLIHIALRQVRLSYEVSTKTGNDAIDVLIKGIGCELDDYDLENE